MAAIPGCDVCGSEEHGSALGTPCPHGEQESLDPRDIRITKLEIRVGTLERHIKELREKEESFLKQYVRGMKKRLEVLEHKERTK